VLFNMRRLWHGNLLIAARALLIPYGGIV
jgi:hypothetical protein